MRRTRSRSEGEGGERGDGAKREEARSRDDVRERERKTGDGGRGEHTQVREKEGRRWCSRKAVGGGDGAEGMWAGVGEGRRTPMEENGGVASAG